ncbi:MAG: 30S ribosomal protein S8 [Candidatus Magasanikbacteria bacterium GW2011_GWC2_37_14]|uniref:Small ribosomal subunit protein uS8 n=1 Tax=Candidatus Magasanikbacteria bacterium GW2011_GWC2_37_14 TaxID=1619046 RepID=A0A0G0G7R2_9BACT|nr:MAG: 30S ribosomal protein S8 [Candidatus Magasanikbacteria bacterium GW2011_GWC2_37_14]
MMTDPIADLLTRIRNAQSARKTEVEIMSSKLKAGIINILVTEGYLEKVVEQTGTPKKLLVTLKYNGKQPVIRVIKRESKPGHRVYTGKDDLPKVLNDYGIAILSTSKGLMTNKKARQLGLGGEMICSVY